MVRLHLDGTASYESIEVTHTLVARGQLLLPRGINKFRGRLLLGAAPYRGHSPGTFEMVWARWNLVKSYEQFKSLLSVFI